MKLLDYIGKPWREGARGPDAFDCWGLLEDVYAVHLRLAVPPFSDTAACEAFWRPVATPSHLCAVRLGTKGNPHVGIYLALDGGLVMHATKGHGVVTRPPAWLRRFGNPLLSYYEARARSGAGQSL